MPSATFTKEEIARRGNQIYRRDQIPPVGAVEKRGVDTTHRSRRVVCAGIAAAKSGVEDSVSRSSCRQDLSAEVLRQAVSARLNH